MFHRDRKNPQNNIKRFNRLMRALQRHKLYAKLGVRGAERAVEGTIRTINYTWPGSV